MTTNPDAGHGPFFQRFCGHFQTGAQKTLANGDFRGSYLFVIELVGPTLRMFSLLHSAKKQTVSHSAVPWT